MIDLRLGDCLEVMKTIPNGSIDAIITDPPYGTTACKWDSVIDFELMWEQLNRIIKPNGAIVLFGSEPFSSALRMSNINNYKYDWIWEKHNGSNSLLCNKQPLNFAENISVFRNEKDIYNINPLRIYFKKIIKYINIPKKDIINKIGQSADHTFRFNSSQFSMCKEYVYDKLIEIYKIEKMPYFKKYNELKEINKKYNLTYNPQMWKGKINHKRNDNGANMHSELMGADIKRALTRYDGLKYPRNIIFYNSVRNNKKHPTQKPIQLMEYLIKTYTNENETILDFTMGSGTTMLACKNLNRNGIGIEMDDNYFKIAQQRLAESKFTLFTQAD